MWGFHGIWQYTISQLDLWYTFGMPNPLKYLDLADECDVPKWRMLAFSALCDPKEPLTLEVASHLGMEQFVALFRVREQHVAARKVAFRGTSVTCYDHDDDWKELACPHREMITSHRLDSKLRAVPELRSESNHLNMMPFCSLLVSIGSIPIVVAVKS